jgi:hypothetical protein
MAETIKPSSIRNDSWEAFNAAHFQTGVQAEISRQLGRSLLRQAEQEELAKKREALFASLDAQNKLIDTAIALRQKQEVTLSPTRA